MSQSISLFSYMRNAVLLSSPGRKTTRPSLTFWRSQYFGFGTTVSLSCGFQVSSLKGPLQTKFSGLIQSLPYFSMAWIGTTAKE